MQVYTQAFEEVNFFNSYFKSIVHKGNSTIIPVINVGVSEHPLNSSTEEKYINYSYAIFEGLSCFLSGDSELDFGTVEEHKNLYHFGGAYIPSQYHLECSIYADNAALVVDHNYQIRKEMWIPIDTPSLPRNMNPDAVHLFFF